MSGSVRLDRLLANLGYGSRNEVQQLVRRGVVMLDGARAEDASQRIALSADLPARLTIGGDVLDPLPGMALMLHKPLGVTCSHKEAGPLVYDLLPARWRRREPTLSTVGRLDKESSGLLLLTDDGALLHRLTSPKSHFPKVYEVGCKHPVDARQVTQLIEGVMLKDEKTPVRAAACEIVDERTLRLTLTEGKYHQVKRMLAAVANRVETLHRSAFGALTLPADLAPGEWRWLEGPEVLS